MAGAPRVVMAVDPGRDKCGVAVATDSPELLYRGVVATPGLEAALTELAARFHPELILIGNGTTSATARHTAEGIGIDIAMVDERSTTLLARRRYFLENPPRGLRRLIPVSLQTPSEPYDDYVAAILAERYLQSRACG